MEDKLRQPIMVFMGNVDAGKTLLLDKIRNTAIAAKESGGITQAIGASIIPIETIKKICGKLFLPSLNLKLPGLLTIDTPGHAAFTNMRKRGGNLADISILVVDVNEGIKPQTEECIEILRNYKTPFVIALNKIDSLSGWKSDPLKPLAEVMKEQSENVYSSFERKLYEVVGKLAEFKFDSERFDRVIDYTKQIAIVPTSAVTGEGIPELLMVIVGLSQKFLEGNLKVNDGFAKGTIIEVKFERGLGKTLDVVIYDGVLKQNDIIVIGAIDKPIVTRVKALFEPMPLTDMKDRKAKFRPVKEIVAATGVKINASDIEDAVSGMPLIACSEEDIEKTKVEVKKEVDEVVLATDKSGIVVKADSLGSLEAVVKLLKDNNVEIKHASIGPISKKDVLDAEGSFEKYPLKSCVIGFNVNVDSEAKKSDKVKMITADIIYKLLEDFKNWEKEEKAKIEAEEIECLIKLCKIQIMKGYVFRQSNPAIVGIEVVKGTLKVGISLMDNRGIKLTEINGLQHNKESIENLEKGKQAAASLPDVTIGRQISEGDFLYSAVPEEHFKKFKKFKKYLSEEEIDLLREIAEIMRKHNPVWGT